MSPDPEPVNRVERSAFACPVLRQRRLRQSIEQAWFGILCELPVPFVINSMLDHLAKTKNLLSSWKKNYRNYA